MQKNLLMAGGNEGRMNGQQLLIVFIGIAIIGGSLGASVFLEGEELWEDGKLRVMATFYPLAYLTRESQLTLLVD